MKDAEFEQGRKAFQSKQKKIQLLLTNYTQYRVRDFFVFLWSVDGDLKLQTICNISILI